MTDLNEEAALTALALVRQAAQVGDGTDPEFPNAHVMDVIAPYLNRCWLATGQGVERYDASKDMYRLIAALGQWAATAHQKLLEAFAGHPVTKQQLLDSLDDLDHRYVAGAGLDQPNT